jgi:outer membrane pore protein F
MRMTQPIKLLAIGFILVPAVQADIYSDLDRLEKEIETIRQQTNPQQPSPTPISTHKLKVYGTFRPVFTVENDGTDTYSDVRDALSRFGFTGSTAVMESSRVFFRGEWNIRIADGGQIDGSSSGGARKAFVGIEGELGRVAIGKQRPPHYNLIAERVDIFNHAASPYAYDNVGPFFVDNLTTYQYNVERFSFQAAFRSDGKSGEDNVDMVNTGVSFNMNNMYVAAAYLKSTSPAQAVPNNEGAETENIAFSTSIILDKLYLAAAYQDITQTPEIGSDVDVTTLDVSAAYTLPSQYKLKAGIFAYDDGINNAVSQKNQGVNITLERQLADNVRVHVEYLTKDFDEGDTISALSVGFRYSFEADL